MFGDAGLPLNDEFHTAEITQYQIQDINVIKSEDTNIPVILLQDTNETTWKKLYQYLLNEDNLYDRFCWV